MRIRGLLTALPCAAGLTAPVPAASNKVDSSTHAGIAANRAWVRDTSGV
jgi:hypothetical protein